jgi:hypothetical protein
VNTDFECAARAEKACEDGVEGCEEVLARLGFGGGEGEDGRLAIDEDVGVRESGRTESSSRDSRN